MEKMPTAEFFRGIKLMDSSKPYTEEEIMIEFAKLHVEAQAKAIIEITHKSGIPRIIDDKDSILNSYPLKNIK